MTEEPVGDEVGPWPLHERLLGAAVRVLPFVGVGLLVFLGGLRAGFVACAGLVAGAGCAFLLERPDAGWRGAIARQALAGALAVPAVVLAAAWSRALAEGGPGSATYAALGEAAISRPADLLLWTWRGLGAGLLLAPLAVARLSGRRFHHQVGQGLFPAAAGGLMGVLLVGWIGCGVGQAASSLILAPLAGIAAGILGTLLTLGDRLAARVDPRAPTAPPRDPLRNGVAMAAAILGGAILTPLVLSPPATHSEEASALGALKTISTGQAIFQQRHPARELAGSTRDLGDARVIDGWVGTGVHRAYLFRVVRSRRWAGWAAAADPIDPRDGGGHMAVDSGSPNVTWRSRLPIRLDPDDCSPSALVMTETLLWDRAPAHAWAPGVLGLALAWPLALLLGGLRPGPIGAGLGLASAGAVGGWLGFVCLGLPAPDRLPLFFEAARLREESSWLVALALAVAAPPALGRLRWRGPEPSALLCGAGGALLAGLLMAAPIPGDLGGDVRVHLLPACIGTGLITGWVGGWIDSRAQEPPRPGRLARAGLVAMIPIAWLVGLASGARAADVLAPPPAVDGPAARAALLAIHRAQPEPPVASLTELAGVDTTVLSGVAHGHVFRYGRVPGGGWMATADPMGAGEHLAIDGSGTVRAGTAPFPLGPSPP